MCLKDLVVLINLGSYKFSIFWFNWSAYRQQSYSEYPADLPVGCSSIRK